MVSALKKCWETFAGYLARVESFKNDLAVPGVKELDAQMSAPVPFIFFQPPSSPAVAVFGWSLSLFCSSRRRGGREEAAEGNGNK